MAENRNLIATVLLVLSSTAYNGSSGPPPTPGTAASGLANPGATAHENDLAPWRTFQTFAKARVAGNGQRGLKFLIATVPDPVDTHLGIYFDRAIESVVNAASAVGYSFDRYWLSWRENTYAPTADPAIREKQETEKRARESKPGLMLLRGPKEQADLAVFLVGETPTAGINTEQFMAAVRFIDAMNKEEKSTYKNVTPHNIRVVGPNFSGSLPSLAAAIMNVNDPKRKPVGPFSFQVVSGSTTNSKAQQEFKGTVGVKSFSSTLHPDDLAICAFLEWVGPGKNQKEDPKKTKTEDPEPQTGNPDATKKEDKIKVAVLSEGDTAFGAGFTTACSQSKIEFLSFPFPRDIARLRNAYHEDSFSSPLPDKYKFLPPDGVPLTLKDPNTGHDSVPSFSREHTPISQDATLLNLAVALRRNEVIYVGIAATDPLDTFFLARFLAENTPDIRIFQLDADLMFIRPPESLPLAGMLSITTYPMFAQNQYWTNPGQAWRMFSSKFSQGVYNAALSLLREKDAKNPPLLEYASPFPPRSAKPEGPQNSSPPLWLTAAGRNGYWPVEILDAEQSDLMLKQDATDEKSAEPRIEEPPHILTASLWAITALAVWAAFGLVRARKSDSSWFREFRTESAPGSELVFERAHFILFCVLSLTAIFLCLAGPQWRLLGVKGEWEDWIPTFVFVAAFLVTIAYLVKPLILANRGNQVWAGLCATAFCAFSAEGVWLLSMDGHHQGFFSAYRSFNMSSGLAPNVPLILLFAVFFAWGRVHLQRRILIEERCQSLPKIRIAKAPDTFLCTDAGAAVKNAMSKVCFSSIFSIGIVAAVGVPVFFITWPHLRTLEPLPYLWLYSFGVALLFSLVILTTMQFLDVWTKMERVLDEMESHPIRFALSDLPQDRTWSPIWQSNVRKRSHILLSRGVDCLRALRQKNPELLCDAEWIDCALKDLQTVVDGVFSRVGHGQNESTAQRAAAGQSDKIAERIANELGEGYWRLGSAESPALKLPDSSDGHADKWDRLKAEFVALRVLAYIRYVMLHLRNLLGFLTTSFVLALLSLESYPFQAPQMIMSLTTALFAAIAAATIWVFYRMNRNLILRRITRDEGKSDWNYWMQLAETGALPVLAIVASNIPGAGRFLFSWLGPMLDKLH